MSPSTNKVVTSEAGIVESDASTINPQNVDVVDNGIDIDPEAVADEQERNELQQRIDTLIALDADKQLAKDAAFEDSLKGTLRRVNDARKQLVVELSGRKDASKAEKVLKAFHAATSGGFYNEDELYDSLGGSTIENIYLSDDIQKQVAAIADREPKLKTPAQQFSQVMRDVVRNISAQWTVRRMGANHTTSEAKKILGQLQQLRQFSLKPAGKDRPDFTAIVDQLMQELNRV